MKKIVIFYASYGGGHLAAAKSIQEYINENYPNCKTYLIDCVKSISKPINSVTTGSYKWLTKNAPKLWGNVYSNSNKGILGKISTSTNHVLSKRLCKILLDIQPDIVISAHPFGSQMTSYLKEKNKLNCKLACILTDFEPHEQYLVGKDFVDYYFVAHEKMKYSLIDKEVEESKIFDTGIPISTRFSKKYDKTAVLQELGLDLNKKTILFFGGRRIRSWKRKNSKSTKITFKSYRKLSNCCNFRKKQKNEEKI